MELVLCMILRLPFMYAGAATWAQSLLYALTAPPNGYVQVCMQGTRYYYKGRLNEQCPNESRRKACSYLYFHSSCPHLIAVVLHPADTLLCMLITDTTDTVIMLPLLSTFLGLMQPGDGRASA